VLNRYINATALAAAAALCSASLAAQAQTTSPTQQQPQTPPSSETRATPQQATTTVTGCVYREKDVPGRAPNVAERAGILEDYILAEVSASKDQPSTTGTAGTPGATGTSGTMRSGAMYKLEFADDDKLNALVGKRVEVTGRIDAEAGDATRAPATPPPTSEADKALGRDQINLSEFEVTSIKEVSGTCPAKPGRQ
jgi:hypothetical protein